MNNTRSVLTFDALLLAVTLALVTIGLLFIYSSGVTSTGENVSREWLRQIFWAGSGLALLLVIAGVDYRLARNAGMYAYFALIALLLLTLLFGRVVNGAKSWIGIGQFGVQPSEFAKIATVLLLARYLESQGSSVRRFSHFAVAFAVALLPFGLVLLQPDLGTAVVFIPIFLAMAFVAGADARYVAFILLAGLLLIVLTVLPAWEHYIHGQEVPVLAVLRDARLLRLVLTAGTIILILAIAGNLFTHRRYFYWIAFVSLAFVGALGGSVVGRMVLKDYQLMRLIVFMDPYVDPLGAGWNIIQSVTAVGSGGIVGKGWLEGTQSHLEYLPQQSTDFIFSILSEEWGFLGGLAVFTLFAVILVRGIVIATHAKDRFGSLTAVGILTMLFFHFVVNVGMAIGVMPITGIPLFFLSYGGSSLWTALIGVGLLMSIYQHRYRY